MKKSLLRNENEISRIQIFVDMINKLGFVWSLHIGEFMNVSSWTLDISMGMKKDTCVKGVPVRAHIFVTSQFISQSISVWIFSICNVLDLLL